jgi:hypothetical protein
MERARHERPLDHPEARLPEERVEGRRREVVEVGADQPGPFLASQPPVEPCEIHRREREQAFVVEERAQPPQRFERVDHVLEHVEENDGVGASRWVCKLLERHLLEVDAEAFATGLDGPPRGLDAARAPAGTPGRVEEQADVRSDLEEAITADEVAAHDPQDPREELPSALLLAQIVLVHDVRVAVEDLLAVERRA